MDVDVGDAARQGLVQDLFLGGGGRGPTAYVPSEVTTGGGGGGGGRRDGGDTPESEDEQDRKRTSQFLKTGGAGGAVKDDAGGGGGSSAPGVKESGSGGVGGEKDDDRTRLAAAKGCPRRAKRGDVLTLIDSVFGRRSRCSKLPRMRVVVVPGNVMPEYCSIRPTGGSSCHSDRADAGLASLRPGQRK
ncbi:unnamed protein product [Ectocarpus fasciculatus]